MSGRSTPEEEHAARVAATRAYSRELARVARCYEEAATAPGLRKDAARYLVSEAERLTRESRANADRADELEHRT
jgi:hypothetical protein